MKFVGAKNGSGVWQRIISSMPPHNFYVEPFLGTGVVARKKLPAVNTIVNDADASAPGLAMLDEIPNVRSFIGDAVDCIRSLEMSWRSPRTLIYCDPPYLDSVRSTKRNYYRFEMREEKEHRRLLRCIRASRCMVMISGYHSKLYHEQLTKNGWRHIEIHTVKRNGARSIEVVWMNFPEPFEFHDTRFLGENFRERERIKRKTHRWKKRLSTMGRYDRAAILSAISELSTSASAV